MTNYTYSICVLVIVSNRARSTCYCV